LSELGVCDYYFVTRKSSSIGLAAVLVAIEQLDAQKFPKITSHRLLEELRGIYPQEIERIKEIKECKNRLLGLYIAGGYDQQKKEMERGRSPDAVIDTADSGRSRQQDVSRVDSGDIPDNTTHPLHSTRELDTGIKSDPTPSGTTCADEGSTDLVPVVTKILKKARTDSTDYISTFDLKGDTMQQDIHTDHAACIDVDPCESAGSLKHPQQNPECVDISNFIQNDSDAISNLSNQSIVETVEAANLKECERIARSKIEIAGNAELHQQCYRIRIVAQESNELS
jgi:hypothetical protein